MYMDDFKVFTKDEKVLETLKQAAVGIYSEDLVMEFGIEKYVMLIMRSGKRYMTKGIELPIQETIRTLGEKETYEYTGILEADTIK